MSGLSAPGGWGTRPGVRIVERVRLRPARSSRRGSGLAGASAAGRKAFTPDGLTASAMPGIATLKSNQNATIDATITAISEIRDVTTSRGASQVADATLQDETGTITLTLWGDDTKRFSVGQKVRITDGWVKDFRGKLQVSMGRSGTISIQP